LKNEHHEKNVHKLNKKEEILSRDIIILMATEYNVDRIGFGFLEDYEYILDEKKSPYELAILKIEESIRNNPDWDLPIKKQAKERKQTIEQIIRANAIFLYNNKKK